MTTESLSQFAACAYEPEDTVELRLLPRRKSKWHKASDLARQASQLAQENSDGQNIYVGANPRRRKGGSKAIDVALARCLFADWDDIDVAEAKRRWELAALPDPTIVIHSGHGVHAYWRLDEPLADLALWSAMQKALIAAVGSDRSIHDPPRIMRLPGFLNCKAEPFVPCEIVESHPERRYRPSELQSALRSTTATGETNGLHDRPGPSNGLDLLARAAAYLAKIPGTSKGCRNTAAYRAAVALTNDFALGEAEAMPLLQQWNQGNTPPLDTGELADVLRSAAKYATKPAGNKLGDRRIKRCVTALSVRAPYQTFPADALPDPLRGFVEAAAEAIGCDLSYVALPALTVLAAAIGNSRRIELKRGWTEAVILWTAIVGESGTAKTPAFKLVMKRIRERQHHVLDQYAAETQQHQADLAQYDKQFLAWKRDKKAAGAPPCKPDAPHAARFIVSDTTVEALAPILCDNPRGLLLARDELSGWVTSFDRYTNGKRGADVAHWLSMHNGETMIVDRKTGSPRTILVPHASVSVTGGIQTEILRRCLGQEHFDNGLAARLLLAWPPRRLKRWTEAEVVPEVEAEFAYLVDQLLGLQLEIGIDGYPKPVVVRLTPTGKAEWIRFYNEHAKEHATLTGELSAAWSKLEAYAARLALVIHYVRWAAGSSTLETDDGVDAQSVAAGVRLSRWFGQEARRIYAMLTESMEAGERRQLVEMLQRDGGSITLRELMRSSSRFATAEDAEAALQDLAKAGFGYWQHDDHDGGRGRPVRRFVLFDMPCDDTNGTNPSENGNCVNVNGVSDPADDWGEA